MQAVYHTTVNNFLKPSHGQLAERARSFPGLFLRSTGDKQSSHTLKQLRRASRALARGMSGCTRAAVILFTARRREVRPERHSVIRHVNKIATRRDSVSTPDN